jgi:hypothetical protein
VNFKLNGKEANMLAIKGDSVVRRLVSAGMCLALAVFAGQSFAQKADRPAVKVGDRWTFEARVQPSGARQPSHTWMISSVTPARIEGTDNGRRLVLTPELNVLQSADKQHGNERLLSFPLEVGKQWSFTDKFGLLGFQMSARDTVSVEVVAHEKVRVPAGEFEAFRLEAKGTRATPSYTGEIGWTYWYAPAARAIVKSEFRQISTHGGTREVTMATTTELGEFQLQP